MRDDVRRLARWLRRAQPPRAALARALVSGLVATLLNAALLVGAVALLVESATRPGLNAGFENGPVATRRPARFHFGGRAVDRP